MPEPMPFGLTRGDANVRAIVSASFVNNPPGGNVETVFTVCTQRRDFLRGRAFVWAFMTTHSCRRHATSFDDAASEIGSNSTPLDHASGHSRGTEWGGDMGRHPPRSRRPISHDL
jgi:hypothetical protein